MDRKLTLLIDEKVCRELRFLVPKRKMSKFVEEALKKRIEQLREDDPVAKGFQMMGKDRQREKEADEWSEAGIAEEF
ncbi:MAG: hypothetical protein JW957_03655 [Candidatus Omnitrophica bacterium]|nr:hypothetical protein [Candidatus Omnitrophota bacterium]